MKKKLKALIAKGKTEKVIQILQSITSKKDYQNFHNEVIILSNQFFEYNKNKLSGVYSAAEQRQYLAQINQGLLAIIDQLNNYELDFTKIDLDEIDSSFKSNQKKWIIIVAVSTLFIISSVVIYQKTTQSLLSSKEEIPLEKDSLQIEDSNSSPIETDTEKINVLSNQIVNTQPKSVEAEKEPDKKANVSKEKIMSILRGDTQTVVGDSVKSFKIARHEVTIEQYLLYCQLSHYSFPEKVDTTYKNRPITYVSWHDAVAYCAYVGGRLPSVIEWELAASGGNKSQGFIYSGANTANQVAWSGKSQTGLSPVKTKKNNELKLYDMSGNAREWCFDSVENRPNERKAKGGSWKSYKEELEIKADATPHRASLKNSTLGFRVAFDN